MSAEIISADAELVTEPGEVEAAAIRADYAASMNGLKASISMGVRLMDVKNNLPRGTYIKWCEKHLGGLSKTHLHRCKFIAEGLLESHGIECPTRGTFEIWPPELLETIEGASGFRSLECTVREFNNSPAEESSRRECEEKIWINHPTWRDEWEPKILAGQCSYVEARRAMLGKEHTDGIERDKADHDRLILRNLRSLSTQWQFWPKLNDETKVLAFEQLKKAYQGAPSVVLVAAKEAIEAELKGGAR